MQFNFAGSCFDRRRRRKSWWWWWCVHCSNEFIVVDFLLKDVWRVAHRKAMERRLLSCHYQTISSYGSIGSINLNLLVMCHYCHLNSFCKCFPFWLANNRSFWDGESNLYYCSSIHDQIFTICKVHQSFTQINPILLCRLTYSHLVLFKNERRNWKFRLNETIPTRVLLKSIKWSNTGPNSRVQEMEMLKKQRIERFRRIHRFYRESFEETPQTLAERSNKSRKSDSSFIDKTVDSF